MPRGRRARAEHFADDAEDVLGAPAGTDVAFGLAGEEEEAGAVVVADGGEAEDGAKLGGDVGLADGERAGAVRSAHIDDEHHGQVPVFAVAANERFAAAGESLPIDITDVVAGDVGAQFVKFDATPAEDGVIFAEEAAR